MHKKASFTQIEGSFIKQYYTCNLPPGDFANWNEETTSEPHDRGQRWGESYGAPWEGENQADEYGHPGLVQSYVYHY